MLYCRYVEQTDVHAPRTTVREALTISALLRLPRIDLSTLEVGGCAWVFRGCLAQGGAWVSMGIECFIGEKPHGHTDGSVCMGALVGGA